MVTPHTLLRRRGSFARQESWGKDLDKGLGIGGGKAEMPQATRPSWVPPSSWSHPCNPPSAEPCTPHTTIHPAPSLHPSPLTLRVVTTHTSVVWVGHNPHETQSHSPTPLTQLNPTPLLQPCTSHLACTPHPSPSTTIHPSPSS